MADLLAVSFEGGEGSKDTLAFVETVTTASPGAFKAAPNNVGQ
ncbi:hypothetical protein ACFC18_47425 [Streptomyces sp. NPDC056121]